MKVGRNTWRAIVNFRLKRKPPHHEGESTPMLVPKDLQPGQIVASVGFFTPSSYAERVRDGPPRAEPERDLPPHLHTAQQDTDNGAPDASQTSTETPDKKLE